MPTNNDPCARMQDSLAWCQGAPVLPGIMRRAYYISKRNIAEWPALDAPDEKTEIACITDSFTLKADAKWKYIDIIPEKSQLTSEPQGEYPSQTQLNKLVLVHPGTGVLPSSATMFNNDDLVFAVFDLKGRVRIVGSERWTTKTTVSQDLGQGATGTAATTINVEATDVVVAPFYCGDIVTDDGTIGGHNPRD